jgi:hypothetical protein
MSSRSSCVRAVLHCLLGAFVALAILLAVATLARAAAPDAPPSVASAEALFTQGKEAMARGDLATACARFRESAKLDPAVGTRLNLAACEEKSGQPSAALRDFLAAQAQLAKDDFRVAFTAERIAALSQRVAYITITASAIPPTGTRVVRDGDEVTSAAWNVRVPVDPGPHVVALEVPGKSAFRAELTLREREEKVFDLAQEITRLPPARTEPAPSPVAPAPAREATSGGARRTAAYVVTGAGVATLALGATAGILTVAAASTYRDNCTNGVCNDAGFDAASRGRTLSVVSPVALALGAIATGAGIYLFATSTPARPSPPRAAQLVPLAAPSAAGVAVVGRF